MNYEPRFQMACQLSLGLLIGLALVACTPSAGPRPDPTRPADTAVAESAAAPTALDAEAAAPILSVTELAPSATPLPRATLTPVPGQERPATPTPSAAAVQTAWPELPFIEDRHFTLLDQYGGQATAVTMEGQTAYVAFGSRLYLLDLSQPSAIKLLGRSQPLAAVIQDVAVRDGLAYLALGQSGLEIMDVSDPAQIGRIDQELSSPTDGPLIATAIDLAGGTAYVSNRSQIDGAITLQRFQLDPAGALIWLEQIELEPNQRPVFAEELLLLVANQRLELRRSAEPGRLLSQIALSPGAFSLLAVVNEDIVSVLQMGTSPGMIQFDISDPANPTLLSELVEMEGFYSDQMVSNGRLLASAGTMGEFGHCGSQINLIELAGAQSRAAASWDPQNCVRAIAIQNNHLLLAGQGGLQWYDVADPDQPQLLATYPHEDNFHAVDDIAIYQDPATATDVLYVLSGDGRGYGILTMEMSATGLDMVADKLSLTQGLPTHLLLAGDTLLAPTWMGDINTIDIRQPADPQLLHAAGDGVAYMSSSVAVSSGGDVIYQELMQESGARVLAAVDLRDPANPTVAGQVAGISGQVTDLLAANQILYLLDQSDHSQLHIYDIAQPLAPQLLALLPLAEPAQRLALVGSDLYVACGYECDSLFRINVANPAAPQLLGQWTLPLDAWQMASNEQGLVYMADGTSNLWLLDAADPADLYWAGHWPYAGGRFKLVGDEIFMASWLAGLYRLQVGP